MRRAFRTDRPSLRGSVIGCVLAVVALSLRPDGEAMVRAFLRDAARPGYLVQQQTEKMLATLDLSRWPWTEQSSSQERTASTAGSLEATLATRDEELRRLRVSLAASRRDLTSFARSLGPVRTASIEAIPAVERRPARVLTAGDQSLRPGGLVLDRGLAQELEPGRLVIHSTSLAVGTETGIAEGEIVLAGATVVGRTDEVGAWTTSVLPVTDPEFRAHIWLVHETPSGPVFGEEGILEGDGRGGCLVKYVPSTASVAVGDHVYSRDPTGRIPQPLYYGRVIQAELRDGAPHWEIEVRPALDGSAMEEVHVLSPRQLEEHR